MSTEKTCVYYNPITNEIRTGVTYLYLTNKGYYSQGFVNLGFRKVAEAFTSVSENEREKLWLAIHSNNYNGIDLTMLPSKIRHKLKKINVNLLFEKGFKTEGEELLHKIKNKTHGKHTR